jgi:hypothetical protein
VIPIHAGWMPLIPDGTTYLCYKTPKDQIQSLFSLEFTDLIDIIFRDSRQLKTEALLTE